MGDTADILKKLALQVRNASSAGENTAERVGRVLSGVLELIDAMANIEELKNLFLSKTSPDQTDFLLKLLGGIAFKNHYGIDPEGHAKLNSLEADYLKIQELIFNRVSAQEGDTSFSESGVIESVELLPDGTYNLILRKRHKTDFTAFDEHDIAYGSVNDLLSGGGNYYSSWFRILSVNLVSNSINIALYPDADVPGGKNSTPEPLMVITRRGNVVNQDRQSYWYISSYEMCICMLDGVTKPILEDYNYSVLIGKMKHLAIFDHLPISYKQSYIFVRGLIGQDIIRTDVDGKPIYEITDRGLWREETASSDEPYYFEGKNEKKKRNETSTVYHLGSKWQCLRTGTLLEPAYGSSDWEFLEGNGEFSVTIESSAGHYFDYGRVNTILEARFYKGYVDVTDTVMSTPGLIITWYKDNGLPEDSSWSPVYMDTKNRVHIVDSDMPSSWPMTSGVATFKMQAIIPQGRGKYLNETGEFGFKI